MKRTFFYSETQKDIIKSIDPNYKPLLINGKEFTEQQGRLGEHKSNFPDAIIVHVQEGLKVDKFLLRNLGVTMAESYFGDK